MPTVRIQTLELVEEQREMNAQKPNIVSELVGRISALLGGSRDNIVTGEVLASGIPAPATKQSVALHTAEPAKDSQITIVSRLKAKDGQEGATRQALARLAIKASEEPGCVNCDALQCADPASCFMLHETWKSERDRKAYMETDYYKDFVAKSPSLFEGADSAFDDLACVPYTGLDSMPSPATIVTRMTAKDDLRKTAKNVLVYLTNNTRKESGCRQYNLYQGINDPSVFVEDEIWGGPQAVKVHFDTDYFKYVSGKAPSLFEPVETEYSPFEVMLCTPVGTGAPVRTTWASISVRENAVLGDSELQAGLRTMNAEFGDLCIRASGEAWGKPLIDQKTKVLIAIAVDVVEQIHGKPFENHLHMAMKQGITREELEELLLFMTIYAGFNKAGAYYPELAQFFGK